MGKIKQKPKANAISDALHDPPNPAHDRPGLKRYAICALILSLSALAAYPLSLRLVSQIYYLRAKNFMQQRYYGLAWQALQKASDHQPQDSLLSG